MGEEARANISPVPPKLLASVVIFGADGDLSSKKILPTLFNLWRRRLLPRDVLVFGFARSPMTDETFRKHIFKCIYHPSQPQGDRKDFLQRCHYQAGQFDDPEAMAALLAQMEREEEARRNLRKLPHPAHVAAALPEPAEEPDGSVAQQVRLYYMAVPPFLYASICSALRHNRKEGAKEAPVLGALLRSEQGPSGFALDVGGGEDSPIFERFVLEKPFGKDTASCMQMVKQLAMLQEDEVFRIDHYLGRQIHLPTYLSIFINSYRYLSLFIHLSIYLYMYLYISICLSIYRYRYIDISMYIYISLDIHTI